MFSFFLFNGQIALTVKKLVIGDKIYDFCVQNFSVEVNGCFPCKSGPSLLACILNFFPGAYLAVVRWVYFHGGGGEEGAALYDPTCNTVQCMYCIS
jgi:hypothetical protein